MRWKLNKAIAGCYDFISTLPGIGINPENTCTGMYEIEEIINLNRTQLIDDLKKIRRTGIHYGKSM